MSSLNEQLTQGTDLNHLLCNETYVTHCLGHFVLQWDLQVVCLHKNKDVKTLNVIKGNIPLV